ncbi:Alcohol dehydrogenase [hydrothermal vent metagenome]|uniref:Alcohol dehydrogenase n=1 Tax=hydrothermal vent metagenome TaxID=652676 RepID=A0A3B0ZQ92_9ZZZZ
MKLNQFEISILPQIIFGAGTIKKLPEKITNYGKKVLLITGDSSLSKSDYWTQLQSDFFDLKIELIVFKVSDEPSAKLVDQAVSKFQYSSIEVVVGIGGGSVLDAAKAIAGLLPFGNSIMDHLEGVGKGIEYLGSALPFIAVPTTAGTGSEATKNAVISERGENGYKKSFRHETLVPKLAIVDSELLISCSAAQIAANGMDAFTQLIESYVSTKANHFTDALALDGIKAVVEGFIFAWQGGNTKDAIFGRNKMAYASLISGITLAQVGLGSVHGLASPLGAFFPIPHGVVCGTLLAEATRVNITAMNQREPKNIALEKYSHIGKMLLEDEVLKSKITQQKSLDYLVQVLHEWTTMLKIPKLSNYGVTKQKFDKIISECRGSSMQTNPIVLLDNEIEVILNKRL